MSALTNVIKRFVIGTPLERPARQVSRWLRPARPKPITEWDLRDARDNAYVRAFLRHTLKRDSICVDVGAHSGTFLRQFLEFAPNARHYAFEPIPALASELRQGFPAMNVRECALSDHDGDSTFQYVKEWPGWSGLRRQPYPTAAQPQTIPIKVRRLDSEIPETERIAFIKIDVEGAELEVLRGAHGILSRDRPAVYFECARIHHEQYETTPLLVHDFLRSCEMAVFLVDETGPLTAQQFADIYEGSHRSGYDRTAWGNYLALPVHPR